MIKIRMHAGWVDDIKNRKGFEKLTKGDCTWNDIFMVKGDDPDYDYLIIVNYTKKTDFDPERTILFQVDPLPIRKDWGRFRDPDPKDFLKVVNPETFTGHIGWSLKKDYNFLMGHHPEKTKIMSGVVSGLNYLDGHKLRVRFIKSHLSQISFYEHFGKLGGALDGLKCHKGQIEKKEKGLFPYKYTFAAENINVNNSFTEKITDAILSECLCFYHGCPNFGDFVDSRAFIHIDINDPKRAMNTIGKAITSGQYEKRLPYIRAAKERILNELHIFPIMEKVINGEDLG